MFNPLVLDAGKDITFYCGGIDGRTTLTACEEFCPKYSSCDTAGWQLTNWQAMKEAKKQVMGLKNLSEKPTARTMPNL